VGHRTTLDRDLERLKGLSFRFSQMQNDEAEMDSISQEAWPVLMGIAGEIRRMREHKEIPAAASSTPDTNIVGHWIIPKSGPKVNFLRLKDALDKMLHHDPAKTDFRLSQEKHYIIFSGQRSGSDWKVEVDVSSFIRACRMAANLPLAD
jgi:hypothetical protein